LLTLLARQFAIIKFFLIMAANDDDDDDIGFFGLPIRQSTKRPRNKDNESAVMEDDEGDDAFKSTKTKTTMKRKQQSGLHSFLRVKLPKTPLTGADLANHTACTLGNGMRISLCRRLHL
jgi:hypothetical protein